MTVWWLTAKYRGIKVYTQCQTSCQSSAREGWACISVITLPVHALQRCIPHLTIPCHDVLSCAGQWRSHRVFLTFVISSTIRTATSVMSALDDRKERNMAITSLSRAASANARRARHSMRGHRVDGSAARCAMSCAVTATVVLFNMEP